MSSSTITIYKHQQQRRHAYYVPTVNYVPSREVVPTMYPQSTRRRQGRDLIEPSIRLTHSCAFLTSIRGSPTLREENKKRYYPLQTAQSVDDQFKRDLTLETTNSNVSLGARDELLYNASAQLEQKKEEGDETLTTDPESAQSDPQFQAATPVPTRRKEIFLWDFFLKSN